MIQPVKNNNIKECVDVIKESFLTVANEFGFTIENAPRFTAFATTEQRLSWQLNQENRPMHAFVVDGKIVFDEVEASSKKQDVTAFVQNVMNNCNFLTKMNLYIFDSSTTVLEIKNVKILENKIVIDGNITIKRAE